MVDEQKYEAVIGLEIHVQLATKSKLFCADASSFGAEPNTQISPITLGHPGTLPKTNAKAIEYAIRSEEHTSDSSHSQQSRMPSSA